MTLFPRLRARARAAECLPLPSAEQILGAYATLPVAIHFGPPEVVSTRDGESSLVGLEPLAAYAASVDSFVLALALAPQSAVNWSIVLEDALSISALQVYAFRAGCRGRHDLFFGALRRFVRSARYEAAFDAGRRFIAAADAARAAGKVDFITLSPSGGPSNV
ncbi:MAG: hypothetical protein KGM43_10145 [Planctomycetota bacterium]|nr:hypothetical protein [Planctomycetota bacterium]